MYRYHIKKEHRIGPYDVFVTTLWYWYYCISLWLFSIILHHLLYICILPIVRWACAHSGSNSVLCRLVCMFARGQPFFKSWCDIIWFASDCSMLYVLKFNKWPVWLHSHCKQKWPKSVYLGSFETCGTFFSLFTVSAFTYMQENWIPTLGLYFIKFMWMP